MDKPSSNSLLDVVIPVYNEEIDLEPSIDRLRTYLVENCPYSWRIVIADNASNDRTPDIAQELVDRLPDQVGYIRLPVKGRGRALRRAWLESKADAVCYMDVDLSTGLEYLNPLVEPLMTGEKHVAIGSRLMPGSQVVDRTPLREFTSRVYNAIIWLMFPGRSFVDAQCGFKALSRQAVQELVPQIKDNAWFFDTELLLRAEKAGYRIHQVPVRWVDDPASTVNVIDTAWKDIKGLVRVRFGG
ncbi:MAG: glycosyltransferase family 2 protein [Anaerolineales bacterium]|nr:glycosyltransferase family 2 protein [Anaerolineales bacterium]